MLELCAKNEKALAGINKKSVSGRRSETVISLLKFVLSYLNFWIVFHSVDDSIHYGKV